MANYVATTDQSGNIQCAVPFERLLAASDTPLVKSVDVALSSSSKLEVTVTDATGEVASGTVQLQSPTQNISTWVNGTTQTIVVGSDGKLYLANPSGAPSTHNPVNKTNDVDWYGAFNSVNDLLKYALSGSSFLAASATVTESDTAPTSPVLGAKWRTTSSTANPYAKNVTYEWDGSRWAVCLGSPQAVVTSVGTRTSAMGVGTHFDNLDFTLHSNDLNAVVTTDYIEVPRDGYYNIDLNINPGSIYTTEAVTGTGVALYSLEIWIDGQVYSSTTQMAFINSSSSTMSAVTLGTSCNTFLNAPLTAGSRVEARMYVTGLTINYLMTLKLTNTD